jgi:hypothetical protein
VTVTILFVIQAIIFNGDISLIDDLVLLLYFFYIVSLRICYFHEM